MGMTSICTLSIKIQTMKPKLDYISEFSISKYIKPASG